MKKIFLLLSLLIGISISSHAYELVKFDFLNNTYGMTLLYGTTTEYNPDPYSYTDTNSGVSFTLTGSTRLWANGVRFYKGSTITFAAPTGKVITKIIIGSSCSYFSVDPEGTNDFSGNTSGEGTWTGSSSTVKLTYTPTSSNKAISTAAVYYDDAPASDASTAPTFSPADGTLFSGSLQVTLSAADGAKIYYSTDGSTPSTEYTAPITITATTTVNAYALESGKTNSPTVSATYTSMADYSVSDIATWLTTAAANTSNTYYISSPLTVNYQNGQNLYVQDNTGSLLVYGNLSATYTPGQRISMLGGKYTVFKNLIELASPNTSWVTVADGDPADPTTVAVADVSSDDMNRYIKLVRVTFDPEEKTATQGDASVALYDKFGITFPTDYGKYDVVGFVNVFGDVLQIYPIEFTYVGLQKATFTATDKDGNAVASGATVAEEALPLKVVVTNPEEGAKLSVTLSNLDNGVNKDFNVDANPYTVEINESGNLVVGATLSSSDDSVSSEFSVKVEGEVAYNLTMPYVEFLNDNYDYVDSPAEEVPVYMYISHQNYRQGAELVYTINGEEYTTDEHEVEIELTEAGKYTYTAYVKLGTKSKSQVEEGEFEIAETACKLKAPVITFTDPEGDNYGVATITNPNASGILYYAVGSSSWYESDEHVVNLDLTANGTYTVRAYVYNTVNPELSSDIAEADYSVDSIISALLANGKIAVIGNSIIAPEGSEIYNVNGAHLSDGQGLQSGIYIVRLANGNAQKVIVK